MNPPALLNHAVRFIFPHVCEICGEQEAGPADSFICRACRFHPKAIRPVAEPMCQICGLEYDGAITTEFHCANCSDRKLRFASARAAAHYKGLVKEVIHRFKYNRQEWYETFLAQLLIDAVQPTLGERPADLIIPIPLHRSKLRARGFNQAERLARRLAEAAAIPFDPKLMERVRDTDSQARLDRDDREANVKGAFKFVGKAALGNRRVLLVDDVLTTGLTASACAGELLKNGAAEVRVWTVARGGLT